MARGMARLSFRIGLASLLIVAAMSSLVIVATAEEPQTAVYLQGSEVAGYWDPSDGYSGEIGLMQNLYDTLLYYDAASNEISPRLAISCESSEDGKTWTFKLREGVKFHTGNVMDANAVKASIERTMERDKGGAFIWSSVDSIEVVDNYTVRFHLSKEAPLNLISTASYAAYIFDPKFSDHDWFTAGNDSGTGPYTVESSEGSEKVIVKKFDDYWGGWEGKHFDHVVFLTVSEASTRRLMMETGKADFCESLPPTDIDALKNNPNLQVEINPSFINLVALYNTQKAPLDSPLVRRALSYLIPYEDTVKVSLGGYGQVSRGVVPHGLWGHSDRVEAFTYSPTTAKALLTEAGYPNGGLTLVLTYPSGYDDIRTTVELWKSACAEVGITLDARAMPTAERNAIARSPDKEKRQDIYLLFWWPDYSNPDSYLGAMFRTQKTPSYGLAYYSNPVFDGLYDYAVTLPAGSQEATDMMVELQNILQRDAPGIAVWDMPSRRVLSASLKGYVDNAAYANVVFWYNCYRE